MVSFIAEVIRAVEPHLPLVIHNVDSADGVTLVIGGENWSLRVSAPWRITRANRLLLGSEEEAAHSWPTNLVTQQVVAVVPQGIGGLDLALVLDGEKILEVFSCHPIEPWILRLPSGPVWVASPTGAV